MKDLKNYSAMKGNHLLLTAATERIVLSGNDTVRYWYGPYGDDVPAPGQTTVQTSTTDNPYRFSGKERTAADYDFGFINKERKDSKNMGNTYQFYYWITKL